MPNQIETYSFGEAIEAIKNGKKAKRFGWNGKNQYIELGEFVSFKTPSGDVVNPGHMTMGNKVIVFYGSIGTQVGWLASQADMLSDDWIIFE